MSQRRWVIAGALTGALLAMLTQAPARWAAGWMAEVSGGHLLLDQAQGSLWSGSAGLVLAGGAGSRDARRLPGRASWQLGWLEGGPVLQLSLDCCTQGPLALRMKPGWEGVGLQLPSQPQPLLRLPAEWLAGLGTPWNTLQLGGALRLSAHDFQLIHKAGRLRSEGELQLELASMSSRLATLAPLGSYRLSLRSAGNAPVQLQLQTLEGALQISGQGSITAGHLQFRGEALAQPGREAALNNLLNVIGRRVGDRSVITIG